MSITIVDWIGHYESEHAPYIDAPIIGSLGGWVKGEQWSEFIAKAVPENQRPHHEALFVAIKEQKLRFGGDIHQNEMMPVFSDGSVGCWSYRAWGDMLAAAWNTIENTDKYHYMNFYMTLDPDV
jgi:hypothetical protein